MKKIISTTSAPAAIGPYSQAVEANNMLFISGQISIDAESGELITGEIEEQTSRVLKNLKAIAESAGYTLADIVKTTVYMTDLNDFQKMNQVYSEFFKNKPARVTVEVAKLPRNVKIEIDAIAVK